MSEKERKYEKAARQLAEAPVEWVQENVHPYVQRNAKETSREYFRRMVLWLLTQESNEEDNSH